MGRPRKYSDEQMVTALTETKGMVYIAAEKIGCEADTIYLRAKSSPAVAQAMKHERGKVVDTAELKLYTALIAGEPWAIQMALRCLGKDRGYTEKTEHLHTGDADNPVEMNVRTIQTQLERYTRSEFAALAARAEACPPSANGSGKHLDTNGR